MLHCCWPVIQAATLSKKYWPAAMKHAACLRNRSPSTALDGDTPHFRLFGIQAHVVNFRPFGTAAYVQTTHPLASPPIPRHARGCLWATKTSVKIYSLPASVNVPTDKAYLKLYCFSAEKPLAAITWHDRILRIFYHVFYCKKTNEGLL